MTMPQIAEPNQQAVVPVFQPQFLAPPPQIPLPPEMPNVAAQAPVGPPPMVKETRNLSLQYPAGSAWATALPGGTPEKPVKLPTYSDYSCAEMMAQIASQKPTEFSLEVLRSMPAVMLNGHPLKQGLIYSLNHVMQFPYVKNTIEQLHGGGDYSLRVLNSVGKQVHSMNFSIEGEPIVTETDLRAMPRQVRRSPMGMVVGESLMGGMRRGVGSSYLDGPADEKDQALIDAKKQELIEMQTTATMQARLQKLNAERELSKAQNREQDEAVRKEGEARERREAQELRVRDTELRKEERESSTMEKLLLALLAKPQQQEAPKQNGPDFALLLKPIELAFAQQGQILTALMSKPAEKPALDMAAILKMSSDANEKLVQMALSNASSASGRHEKLLDTLLARKIDDGDQTTKLLQTINLIDKIRGDEGGDDWHNPDAGFFSNLGNGLLAGIKGLLGNPQTVQMAMGLLNSKLGKPAGNTQFTDSELTPIAQEMERLKVAGGSPMAALPPPQGRMPQQLRAPVQAPRQAAPMPPGQVRVPLVARIDDPIFEVAPEIHRAAPVPVAATPPPLVPGVAERSVPVMVVEPQQTQVPLQPQETEPPEIGDPTVNEAMDIMLDDIETGRRTHDWSQFAFEKWPKALLDELCRAPGDADRWQILQREGDPVLFNELTAKLLSPEGQEQYQNWSRAMSGLLQQHAGNAAHAAA